jgi:hypothetical protein
MLWMRQWMNYSGIGNKETENSNEPLFSVFFVFSLYRRQAQAPILEIKNALGIFSGLPIPQNQKRVIFCP